MCFDKTMKKLSFFPNFVTNVLSLTTSKVPVPLSGHSRNLVIRNGCKSYTYQQNYCNRDKNLKLLWRSSKTIAEMYSEPSQTSRMERFAKTILAFSAPCYTFDKNLNMSLKCMPEKEFKTTFKGNFYSFPLGSI